MFWSDEELKELAGTGVIGKYVYPNPGSFFFLSWN
jgi:hypothetical protein